MKRPWSAEDVAVLRARYPHESTAVVAQALGRTVATVSQCAIRLGVRKTPEYLASPSACRLRRGDHIGKATQFKPGHPPANKGLRRPGWGPGRMRETQFKPGQRRGKAARNYKPIGTERLSKDGYREVKIHDRLPLQSRWRAVHLVLWEAVHGPIPKAHALVFLNGDKTDVRLENLELVTRRALMLRNSVQNLPAPLPQAIQLLGALKRKIGRRERLDAQQQD